MLKLPTYPNSILLEGFTIQEIQTEPLWYKYHKMKIAIGYS